jgi:hypothetical protein
MKNTLVGIALLLFVSGGVVAQYSRADQKRDNIAVAKRFVWARDHGDFASVRSLLAPDARRWFVERRGEGILLTYPWTWTNWDVHFHSHSKYGAFKQEADRVTVAGEEMNDFYRLLDQSPVPFEATWWFSDDGKITGFLFKQVTHGTEVLPKLQVFAAWAKEHHPTELDYIMPNGEIDSTGDRPPRWRALLTEWRKSTGLPAVKK